MSAAQWYKYPQCRRLLVALSLPVVPTSPTDWEREKQTSRVIVEAVANSLVTNKDYSGADITITIGANPPIDLPRYVDPWGMSIRYEYLPGTAFPVLTSAGPDKIFDTPDDITSK